MHRDLKPANIMIDAEGEAMIMDFGIARSTGGAGDAECASERRSPAQLRCVDDVTAKTRWSAPSSARSQYMAPEQARGETVDQRADIYAFGLILYDMLLGRPPPGGTRRSAIAELKARMEHGLPPVRAIVADDARGARRVGGAVHRA